MTAGDAHSGVLRCGWYSRRGLKVFLLPCEDTIVLLNEYRGCLPHSHPTTCVALYASSSGDFASLHISHFYQSLSLDA